MIKTGWISFILAIVLVGSSADALSLSSCEHFWLNGTEKIPSHKSVGSDVGRSPYGPTGVYSCRLDIESEDLQRAQYLYLGEVGDSAYAVVRGDETSAVFRPITHGLSPDSAVTPNYLRFLPFVIPIHLLYRADGVHTVDIYYRDIIPGQVGLRSGAPTIENARGVFRRAVVDSPALTFHIFQTIFLFVLGTLAFFWTGPTIAQRLSLATISYLAMAVIFSITAIPRFWFSEPMMAVKFGDVCNLFLFSLCYTPLLLFTDAERGPRPQKIVLGLALGTAIYSVIYWNFLFDLPSSLYFYSAWVVGTAIVMPTWLIRNYLANNYTTRFSLQRRTAVPYVLAVFTAIIVWDDIFNIMVFDLKYPFLVHFLFILPVVLWQARLNLVELAAGKKFSETLLAIKDQTLGDIANDSGQPTVFDPITQVVATLMGAQRVSIVEFTEDKIRFLGTHGGFKDVHQLSQLVPTSIMAAVVQSRDYDRTHSGLIADGPDKGSRYYIVPLTVKGQLRGFLCATNFHEGYLTPFVRHRIAAVQGELELFLSLLMSERDNRSQSIIVQTARLRVHPLQLASERYFIDHFNISYTVHQPAFLIGDLVDSTPLNRTFGAPKMGQAMDYFLERLFERNKHLGLVISRRNGDEISIIVPNQQGDASPDEALYRLYQISSDIVQGDLMAEAAKKFGIVLPFQFKCVASQGDAVLVSGPETKAVPSFTLLSDSEIDASSRVLSKIALRGECLFMERAGLALQQKMDLVELPKDRLRGILASQKLFLVNADTLRRGAA